MNGTRSLTRAPALLIALIVSLGCDAQKNPAGGDALTLENFSSLALANLQKIETAKGTFVRESEIRVRQPKGESVNRSISEVQFVFKSPSSFKFIQSVTREDQLQSGPAKAKENLVTVFTSDYSIIQRIYPRRQDTIWIDGPKKISPGVVLGDSIDLFSEGFGFHTYVPVSVYVSAMMSSPGAVVNVKNEGRSTIDGKECTRFVVNIEQKGKKAKTLLHLSREVNGGIVRAEMVRDRQIVESTQFEWLEQSPHIWMWTSLRKTIGMKGITDVYGHETIVIENLQVNLPLQEHEFDLSGLNARPGTKVHDELQGTEYMAE